MSHSILDRIESFVMAVNNVTPDIEKEVQEIITNYLQASGGDMNYEVFINEGRVRNERAVLLTPRWYSYSQAPKPLLVRDPDTNGYPGHADFCFSEGRAIWVHANGGLLKDVRDPANLIDDLGQPSLPQYRAYDYEASRTSIVMPLRVRNRDIFGFLAIESGRLLRYNEFALKTLERIAAIICRVIRLSILANDTAEHLKDAVKRIRDAASQTPGFESLFTRPVIFQAHAARARGDVLALIEKVVEDVRKQLESQGVVLDKRVWSEDTNPDNIVAHMVDTIMHSTLGIAYLSEPTTETQGDYKFIDNSNVLFESGMMGSLTEQQNDFRGWISIRERSSPRFPFDIAQKRTVLIERDPTGKISNSENVKEFMFSMISELLLLKQ